MTKIFCVGLPKTGLSSLLAFMFENGFDAFGKSHTLSKYYYDWRLDEMARFYDQGEYHCDVPTPFAYEALFERYGSDAKYILTTRKDAETWYASMLRHNTYAHPLKHKQKRFFGTHFPHGFEAAYLDFYSRHNGSVADFFEKKTPANFMIMRTGSTLDLDALCDFIGIEPARRVYPKANVSGTREESSSDAFKRRFNGFVQPLYGRICARLYPDAVLKPRYIKSFSN
ncbi:hypothetical protein HPQ64_12925 [Rhizobiales bacterium]|uniref:sulfotransferase n=1 Tax=Hongsoonwoonella zoysiae TaxID=2821844 RepID=UPI0015614FBF|nr:sulfotransferase [Hongsoonwoonella zoysiae]NRG18594.1 hypothetical protein [Hongsoonwoonella zoysiae]